MSKLTLNIFFIASLFFSCNSSQSMKLDQEGAVWIKYVFSSKEIIKEFNKLYPFKEQARVFKIIISRRDHFVRVNIYQVSNMRAILDDLPNSIEKNGMNIFLFYNGMEVINDRISKDKLIKNLEKFIPIDNRSPLDPKVLQFDIDLKSHVQFNYPPVNPYDIEIINTIESKFPKIK